MSLQIIETLYHGTISQIQTIDVTKGRDNKDFGKGFYMATTKSRPAVRRTIMTLSLAQQLMTIY